MGEEAAGSYSAASAAFAVHPGEAEVSPAYYYDGAVCAMEAPVDEETFLTPALMTDVQAGGDADAPAAGLAVEGRRLLWEVAPGTEGALQELAAIPAGECRESAQFWVAGAALRLAFFPNGATPGEVGTSSVALLSEEKVKLKFEVFLNGRTSGRKVLLGKKYSCDFRQPACLAPEAPAEEAAPLAVGVEVHENLCYAGYFY